MLQNLINRIFLRKEIISRKGELHFKRWGIETPWLGMYVHYIAKSDEDEHMHDHPWPFSSVILSGGYYEHVEGAVLEWRPFETVRRSAREPHRIELFRDKDGNQIPTWSFVIVGKRLPSWGYHTEIGWIDSETYRQLKNERRKAALDQQIVS